ncbi:Holliday junction branch migration protein RuvA [Candidatus Saccharibacteria bacterium]|nr:Holliday junction branch migration protein RuvA [Candidatus Saccharibacteria bacterium]
MFAFLAGEIKDIQPDGRVILMVGGLGFDIQISTRDLASIQLNQELNIHIYEHIREDQFSIYGFMDIGTKNLFIRLIGVSGVGPKVALTIISSHKVQELIQAIEQGDTKLFEQISGVGKRTAQKIILDLRGKLVIGDDNKTKKPKASQPLFQALEQLGYKSGQIMQIVGEIDQGLSLSDQIKLALNALKK